MSKREQPLAVGDKVTWTVSNGFCSQAYDGTVRKLRKLTSYVFFETTGQCHWIANEYLVRKQ